MKIKFEHMPYSLSLRVCQKAGLTCRHVPLKVLSLYLTLQLFAGTAQAQEARLSYQPREDRMEGLTNLLDVSDDGLVLVSFKGIRDGSSTNATTARLQASFDLTVEGEVKISVMSFEVPEYGNQWYKMLKQGTYSGTGLKTYAWPATLVDELHIPQQNMHVLASLNRGGKRKIFPSIIHREPFDQVIDGYAFTFWPRTLADVTASIVDVRAKKVIWQKRLSQTLAYRPYTLRWDGTGIDGEPLEPGAFILVLKPGFHQLDGTVWEAEPYVYHFDHTWTIRQTQLQN